MSDILAMLNEIRPEHDFASSSDFAEEGLLDSFDIISLVDMLEEKYQIKIDALDILPENFCSVEAIVALVKRSGGSV